MLRIELEAFAAEGFDLDITGFDADALAELIAGDEPDNEGQTDEDAVPEVGEIPISRPGDVWIMGQHRLLCGDSTVAESYARLMQGDVADMVFTDPPYNVNYANSAKDKMRGKDRAILGTTTWAMALRLPAGSIDAHRGELPGRHLCTAMSSSELDVLQAPPSAPPVASGRRSSSGPRTPSRWAAPTTSASTSRSCTDGPRVRNATGVVTAIRAMWNIKKPQKNDLHPTMKPVELVERAIRNSSRPGNVVLDPFGGSGTTLIAQPKSQVASRG